MRKLQWSSLAFFALLAFQQTAWAQENATVTGRVTSASGAPEVAVAIRILQLGVGTTTIQDGSYRLVVPGSRLPSSRSVTISATRQGLATSSRTVTLGAGANVTQNFQLAASAVSLDETVVTGSGKPASPKPPAPKSKPKPKAKPKTSN